MRNYEKSKDLILQVLVEHDEGSQVLVALQTVRMCL